MSQSAIQQADDLLPDRTRLRIGPPLDRIRNGAFGLRNGFDGSLVVRIVTAVRAQALEPRLKLPFQLQISLADEIAQSFVDQAILQLREFLNFRLFTSSVNVPCSKTIMAPSESVAVSSNVAVIVSVMADSSTSMSGSPRSW